MKSTNRSPIIWKALCAVLAILLVVLTFKKPFERVVEKEVGVPVERVVERIVEKIVEVERPPEPVPEPILGIPSDTDLAKTSKGFSFSSRLEIENGELATQERRSKSSYRSEHILTVKIPRAAATMEELEVGTPGLSAILPGLPDLLESATVSEFYETMYGAKTKRLSQKSAQLGELLTAHNFFDCQTMLNLQSDEGRKVFLMQGDMDVVSDGSDGDRLPTMPDEVVNSSYYQPTTSYGWAKTGDTPNPMIAGYERRLANARAELRDPGVSKERKDWVRSRITNTLVPGIAEMKRRSFLVADYDPFIVIPINIIVDRRDKWGPKVGDYALVIHERKVYPAIVGDAGPSFKVGEASLRMAKQINPKASSYWRPVSDLTVTYLCFPNTGEDPHFAPDYEFWTQRCQELLAEIGGLGPGYELFHWENTLPDTNPPQVGEEAPAVSAEPVPE